VAATIGSLSAPVAVATTSPSTTTLTHASSGRLPPPIATVT
jgi:hypothetical protein